MIKYLVFILSLLFLVNSASSAYFDNSSYENLTYDPTGWCPTIELTYTIYNESDYERREEIEDDLCDESKNETPEDDDCEVYTSLEGMEYVIYDGPFEYSPVFQSGKLDENNQFKVLYPEIDQYLFELPPNDKSKDLKNREFNDLHDIIQVIDCPWLEESFKNTNSSLTGINRSEILKNLAPEKQDITFTYDGGVELDIKNTTINYSNEMLVVEINNFTKRNLPEIEGNVKAIEIIANNKDYSSLDIKVNSKLSSEMENKVYRYNSINVEWEEVENAQINEDNVVISSADLGVYSITSNQKEEVDILNTTQTDDVEDNLTVEDDVGEDLQEESSLSSIGSSEWMKSIGIAVGVIVLIVIIVYVVILIRKPKKDYHEYRDVDNHKVEVNPNAKVLENMSDAKKRSRDYVQKYKGDYTKDQIYRALKAANIPKDVIDDVFKEEF